MSDNSEVFQVLLKQTKQVNVNTKSSNLGCFYKPRISTTRYGLQSRENVLIKRESIHTSLEDQLNELQTGD